MNFAVGLAVRKGTERAEVLSLQWHHSKRLQILSRPAQWQGSSACDRQPLSSMIFKNAPTTAKAWSHHRLPSPLWSGYGAMPVPSPVPTPQPGIYPSPRKLSAEPCLTRTPAQFRTRARAQGLRRTLQPSRRRRWRRRNPRFSTWWR